MPASMLAPEEVAYRRGRVVDLRRQRLSWDQIGAELGVTKQRAHQIYQAALNEYPVSKLGEHRQEEAELIDRAVRELLAIASAPTDSVDQATGKAVSARTRVEAWQAIRGWSEHRAKLFGLLAPTKSQVDVVTHDSLTREMERLAAELGEQDAGGATREMVDAALTSATADQDA